MFHNSLSQETVPSCPKRATIPLPKRSAVCSLNDYHPEALTSILMQSFEKLVRQHIKDNISVSLDPHQYAIRTN